MKWYYSLTIACCCAIIGAEEKSFCEKQNNCKNVQNKYGCKNANGGNGECLCLPGFKWNSTHCNDINECEDKTLFECPAHSTCKNTPGSYECQCDAHYKAGENSKCYAIKDHIFYKFNFTKGSPYREPDGSRSYPIPGGFHYYGNFIFSIHVGFDGYIGLDAPPPFKYFGTNLATHLIAPFWMDLDVIAGDKSSGLYIDVYNAKDVVSETWLEIKKKVVEDLNTTFPDNDIESDNITTMFVMTWLNVAPAPATEFSKMFHTTFQVILAAGSGFSTAIFNYLENPVDSKWPTKDAGPHLQPRIGFTKGSAGSVTFQAMNGEEPNFGSVFVDNDLLRGRLVEMFGDPLEVNNAPCLEFYNDPIAVKNANTIAGFQDVPACPGFLKMIENNDAFWQKSSNFNEIICYRRKLWQETTSKTDNTDIKYHVRPFCCYEKTMGTFMSSPTSYYTSYVEVQEFNYQSRFFESCCRECNYCDLFAERNPPGNIRPEKVKASRIAYVRGDPHVGRPSLSEDLTNETTFNSYGEFNLLTTMHTVKMQIRFLPLSPEKNVTYVTAIAIKASETDTIEFMLHNGARKLLKNGVEVPDKNLPLIDDQSYSFWTENNVAKFISVIGITVQITEQSSTYFDISVALPQNVIENSCGLLTTLDSANATCCCPVEAEDEGQVYDCFVKKYKLENPTSSLFAYPTGTPSYAEVNNNNVDWKPIYRKDLPEPTEQEKDACGDDKACIFDYHFTEDAAIGENTKHFGETVQGERNNAGMKRPQFLNLASNFVMNLTEDYRVITLNVDSSEEKQKVPGFYYELDTNLPQTKYKFNRTTGIFGTVSNLIVESVRALSEPPYLRFTAVNGEAKSFYMPQVWTCACDEPFRECDFSIETKDLSDRLHRTDHNYFYPCICPVNKRGQFCTQSFNVCDEKPCGKGTCTEDSTSNTGFKCECPPGHVNDTGICKQKVCSDGYCTNGKCDVIDGSFKCNCEIGFEESPNDDRTCVDVNECLIGTHNCTGVGSECVNSPGSWVCRCKTGYKNGKEENTCVKAEKQLAASITAENVISRDGKRLIAWSEQLRNPSSEDFKDTKMSLEESLLKWYKGDLKQQSVSSILVKEFFKGSIQVNYLVNIDVKDSVKVDSLFKLQVDFLKKGGSIEGIVLGQQAYNSVSLTDDLCQVDSPCDFESTTCKWDGKSIRCHCRDGYIPNQYSGLSCLDNCTNICLATLGQNSRCVRTQINAFECSCNEHFVKEDGKCISTCTTQNCTGCLNDCGSHGDCVLNKDGTSSCRCQRGYSGKACENCATGYTKNDTECRSICEMTNACGQHGKCSLIDENTFTCVCAPGYGGPTCRACLVGFDGKDNATCSSTLCTTTTCNGNGICVIDSNLASDTCLCNMGYLGSACKDCALGYKKNGNTCVPVCSDWDCGKGTCLVNNITMKGECICPSGFAGPDCRKCIAGYFLGNDGRCQENAGDQTTVIVVSAVLGSACFILICVAIVLTCMCYRQKADLQLSRGHESVRISQAERRQTAIDGSFPTPPSVSQRPAPNIYRMSQSNAPTGSTVMPPFPRVIDHDTDNF